MNQKISQKRQKVYDEVKSMFGLVPSFLKLVPDSTIEEEWKLMKVLQFDEGPIPNKYRELIGLGISAATRCKYCTLFHTEAAKLNGATEAEIEDALHFAKHTAGWSTYLNGMQIDYEQFSREVKEIVRYVNSNMHAAQTGKRAAEQEA